MAQDPSHPEQRAGTGWLRSSRARWLLAAAIVLVLVAGIALAVVTSDDPTLRLANPDDIPTDPELATLSLEPNPHVVTAPNGTPHIPPCRVLSPEDLSEAGMRFHETKFQHNGRVVGISRVRYDYVGEATFEADDGRRASPGHCSYTFGAAPEHEVPVVNVDVYETAMPYAEQAFDMLAANFDEVGTVEGLALHEASGHVADERRYALESGEAVVMISGNIPIEEVATRLVEIAAANVQQLHDEPEGPAVARYRGTPLDGEAVDACRLLANEPIRQITSNDATPYANEILPFHARRTSSGSDYIRHRCQRTDVPRHPDEDDPPQHAIGINNFDLTVRTFASEDGAEAHFDSDFSDNIGAYDESFVLSGTGDDAYAGMSRSGPTEVHLFVRTGRVTFTLEYFHREPAQQDLERSIAQLEPLTEHIVATLRGEGY
ncbi:hypothetical protein [Haloechinothrix sp. LS1_15]|uniref:hypothetical protein n=1 Tax=Haloechinothrix sp. LS1_15 TaxID=2652248 RepID=UPI0029464DA9|nr:hypothetical protein [Haloechinothrix sp. LS1_15]MDV6012317.1 hypothetical protein [Haloechinothrix sp. LS1_15]